MCTYVFYVKGFNGYKIDGLPVGQHEIIFQYTPTGSSEPVCGPPQKFIVWPTSEFVAYISYGAKL